MTTYTAADVRAEYEKHPNTFNATHYLQERPNHG